MYPYFYTYNKYKIIIIYTYFTVFIIAFCQFQVEPEQIIKDLTHPCVTDSPEMVIDSVEVHDDPYTAANTTHAIVICTEWDEFVVST